MGFTRILLVGVLVIAAVMILATAIVYSAPYIAAFIILVLVGKFLLWKLDRNQEDNQPPKH